MGVDISYTILACLFSFHIDLVPAHFLIEDASVDLQYFSGPFFVSLGHL